MKTSLSPLAVFFVITMLGLLAGCGPGRPAVDTYQVSVTFTSPAQGEEARLQIAQLFADIAGQRGLIKESKFPAHEGTLYFPGPTGLNLSLSALKLDEHTIAVSLIPVELGKKDNAGCRAVIATVDQALTKQFAARLVKSP
jgi:hypothetical protein